MSRTRRGGGERRARCRGRAGRRQRGPPVSQLLRLPLEINRGLGDRFRETVLVFRFARVLAFAGRAETAARILAAGDTLHEEIGGSPMGWLRRANDEALTLIRAQLDERAFAEAWEHGRALTADEAVALALDSMD